MSFKIICLSLVLIALFSIVLCEDLSAKKLGKYGDKKSGKPSPKSVGKPSSKSVGKPGQKPIGKPGQKPIGKPGIKPVRQSGKSEQEPERPHEVEEKKNCWTRILENVRIHYSLLQLQWSSFLPFDSKWRMHHSSKRRQRNRLWNWRICYSSLLQRI